MSDMQQKFVDKAGEDREDIRAADPEEGVTSFQNISAQNESPAEGERLDEPTENTAR
ncbi:hypothetical protein [Kitasatospora sp. GP82]|uniref:hypothetical protein n=1 Tax=Kitasatospora sp. GP82 TaxID=3035089 RepID=UPI002474FA23|nr:hypothetical protein [Kitasatospora sp. GP82]MDH6128875.1 hypothetical protein [Kitasatospora sp. GP82]